MRLAPKGTWMAEDPKDKPAAGPARPVATQPRNPLHGITLEQIVTRLVAHYGWAELGRSIPLQCFRVDPSISSSLKFLRRTPWARTQVETLYLRTRLPKHLTEP
jgi:uncharacterized protein (DUF2132 family)